MAGRSAGRRILALMVVLLAALALAGCEDEAGQAGAAAPPPPAVSVVPVARTAVTQAEEFVGRVEAVEHVDLRARVQGYLNERAFVEGEEVAAGDLLFVIEPDPFEAAVARARASMQAAQAMVPQTQNALERAEQLFQRGNIAESSLDEAIAAAAQAEAEVDVAEAVLREAEINLGYTRIRSPIDGRTGRAAFTEGNLVGPDSGVLASVTSMDPIHVNFNISERDLIEFRQSRQAGGLAVDQVVLRLRMPNDLAYAHDGRIDFVAPGVDPNTGTVPIRGVFPNPERLLLPGGFVTVIASAGDPSMALTVPQAAVQQDQAGPFVLMVGEENRVESRRVTIAGQQEADWVIEGGVDEGDLVIVQGLQRVRPGIVVDPVIADTSVEG
jgi:membrane fusion protein (multidrug efflux system)